MLLNKLFQGNWHFLAVLLVKKFRRETLWTQNIGSKHRNHLEEF